MKTVTAMDIVYALNRQGMTLLWIWWLVFFLSLNMSMYLAVVIVVVILESQSLRLLCFHFQINVLLDLFQKINGVWFVDFC